jgi:hypothetical protein
MLHCKECNEEFETEDEAIAHLQDQHSTIIDEELQEYLGDAERAVYDQLIIGNEE